MAERTAALSARVPPTLKQKAQAAAKADGRTLAQWIERTITKELAEEVRTAGKGRKVA